MVKQKNKNLKKRGDIRNTLILLILNLERNEKGFARKWAEMGGNGRKWAEMSGNGRKWAEMGGNGQHKQSVAFYKKLIRCCIRI
jgi:hypothetical protein